MFALVPPVDVTPPSVNTTSPSPLAENVAASAQPTANMSEAMNAATITTTNFELRDASNALVPATVSYNSVSRSARLTPSQPLQLSTTYTARLKGGATGVKDTSGNAMAADHVWSFSTASAPPLPPDQGPGGPILVVTSAGNKFGLYLNEVLRAEGMTEFGVADIATVNATTLLSYDVVLLGEMALSAAQVNVFTNWVNAGGNLIAMRPDPQLAGLLGLTAPTGTISDAYYKVNTSVAPGAGIYGETMQFHGTANQYTLAGATAVATLYSNSTTATAAPAVTMRAVGANGGHAVAFAFDLARSVVYTRQGNPAWNGLERDGFEATAAFERSRLRRSSRRESGLGGPEQDPGSAGRRAAAPAGQRHSRDGARPQAAAALLVHAQQAEGRLDLYR